MIILRVLNVIVPSVVANNGATILVSFKNKHIRNVVDLIGTVWEPLGESNQSGNLKITKHENSFCFTLDSPIWSITRKIVIKYPISFYGPQKFNGGIGTTFEVFF